MSSEPKSPAATPALSPEELAARFPQYEIQVLLGRGGMGAVYRARHRKLDRLVAIKVLLPDLDGDPEFAERFTREARALARLTHPGIVGVHDFGEADGFFYLVLEFVDGANLRELLHQGQLTAKDVLALIPQICDALQYAHDQGIVHRDIKPENILVDQDGRARIADFGLAKIAHRDGQASIGLTRTDQAVGTPHYMAPEQVVGAGVVDHRADIYSLGVVLYEMLTGEPPLGRFAPPSARAPGGANLDDVVMKSLERDPDQRYQQAREVRGDLEAAAQPRAAPRPPPPAARPTRPTIASVGWADPTRLALVVIGMWLPWGGFDGPMRATGWNVSVFELPGWIVAIAALALTTLRIARRSGSEIVRSLTLSLAGFGTAFTGIWLLANALDERLSAGPGALLEFGLFAAWLVIEFHERFGGGGTRHWRLRRAARRRAASEPNAAD